MADGLDAKSCVMMEGKWMSDEAALPKATKKPGLTETFAQREKADGAFPNPDGVQPRGKEPSWIFLPRALK